MSRQFFLLPTLFFVAAAQAAPDDTRAVNKEQVSVPATAMPLPAPEPRLPGLGGDAGRGGRYGAGYESRQSPGAGDMARERTRTRDMTQERARDREQDVQQRREMRQERRQTQQASPAGVVVSSQ